MKPWYREKSNWTGRNFSCPLSLLGSRNKKQIYTGNSKKKSKLPRDKVIHCFQVCIVAERQVIGPSVLRQFQWKTFQQWSWASYKKRGTLTQRPSPLTAAAIAKSQLVSKSAESELPRTVEYAEAAGDFWAGPGGEKSLLLSWVADQLSLHCVFTLPDKYLTNFFFPPLQRQRQQSLSGGGQS